MEPAAAAELKAVLVGISLPTKKPELLEYAVQQHAEPPLLAALRTLSDDKEYDSLDAVVEELLRMQPARLDEVPHEPKEESGRPPGGDAYVADN